jgi:uncharacterized protein (DUF342 family)
VAQAGAKGNLALTIDELGLEAVLQFTPEAEGAEWTAEKLMRLVMDARLSGMNQKRAEEILGKFSRSRGSCTEVLARGQAPEEPVPEEIEWEDITPPPGLDSIVAGSIAGAPEPELFRIRIETIKSEKIVKKPAALPFLPPKEEKVEVVDKREVKERLYPDLEVVKTGFVKRGARIGLLSTAKPGKAGKSIFGKPITVAAKDSTFILGSGVTKNKSELLADYDGIVRAGERWVEVIPLAIPSWSVGKSADGMTWLLDYSPGDSRLPRPSPEEILAAATESGAPPDTLLSAAEIGSMLASAAASEKSLFGKSLSASRDAKIEVKVSPDNLLASLSLWKGRGGGAALELPAVTQAMKAAGVRPLQPEQFKKDILEFYKSERSELLDYVLAEGKAPTRGADRTVTLQVFFLPDSKAEDLRPRLAANPLLAIEAPSLQDFPLDEGVKLGHVQAGQCFGELSAQATGQPGQDIHGNALPGLPGNDPVIRTYENVVFQKGRISASVSGLLFAAEKEGSWSFRVLPFRDASIEVSVSPDSMAAFVSLQAEVGIGLPLTVEGLLAALAAKGVVAGLDAGAVASAVAAARAGQVVMRKPVAAGIPPRAAGSGRRLWLVGAEAPHEGPRPQAAQPIRVAAGTPLLRIELAQGEAAPGTDVLGHAVAPAPADTLPPPAGPGAAAKEADGSLLYSSAVAGELRLEGRKLSIIERLVVRGDVGQESGNLKFAGPIMVNGSVRRGFQLIAAGDAAIAGGVEASLVSSDASILVKGGVKGERRGTLRAKRGIDVGYAEQALLLAVDDIKVRGSCALCSVKTNGRLLVLGDKGTLVGGLCRARKGVDATDIGSANGIKTEISFGQDYLIADMIEVEERELEKLKAAIVQSDRAMADAERVGAGLDRVRQDKVKLVKLLEMRSIRLFDLREKYEGHFAASEVRVRGTIYPGVILESHNRFFEVRSRRTAVSFAFDPQSGRIVERPLAN